MKLFTKAHYNVWYVSGVKADHFTSAAPACVPCVRSYLELRGRVAIEASKTSGSGKVCTKTKQYTKMNISEI